MSRPSLTPVVLEHVPNSTPYSRPFCTWASAVAVGVLALPSWAGDLSFTAPQFLPGDLRLDLAAGHQVEPEIAAGPGTSLAVWSDVRSSLDDSTNPEGSGYDIYAALLDAAGNTLESFMIDEGPGDQTLPHIAWNGRNWLVAWIEPKPGGLPVFERIRGVRVAADGTVLDATPFLINEETHGCYCNFFGLAIAGGGLDGWVVVFQANANGLRAVRVQDDGSVVNSTGLVVSNELSQLAYDITFALDEYMIVYGDGTSAIAKRYSPTLQFLGSTGIPFAREVTTDGTNFLIAGQWDYSFPPKVEATLLAHDGTVLVPRFIVAEGTAQSGLSGEGVGFDGTNYWVTWGGNRAARVSPTGALLDPVGGFTLSLASQGVSWPAYDTAQTQGGGLQYVWNDGLGGAGYPKDTYTARITPTGQVIDESPLSVNAPAQVESHLATGAGTNLIVFRSRSSRAARILAQRVDDNGLALDPEPVEVAHGPVQWLDTPSIDAPQVAWNGSVFMIVWSDTTNVLARRMNPDGTFVDATPLVIMPGRSAAVGALGSTFLVGGSTIVYFSGTLQPPGALRVARVDGVTGAVLDAQPILVGGASDRHPHIVVLGGRWLVMWESVTHDPHSSSVFYGTGAVFVEADGTTTGQLATQLSRRPNVAVAGDRALLVAVDHSVPGGATDLEARILMADGTFLGPKFQLSTAFDEQLRPAATWDGTQFIAAWEDKRNSVIYFDDRTDIYGTRVTPEGVVLDPAGIPFSVQPETEIQPNLLTIGDTTLLAVSTLQSGNRSTCAFRLGIHRSDGGCGTVNYCTASINSSGNEAVIGSTGVPSIGSNNFALTVSNAPSNVFGLFYYGADQTSTVFGDGVRCIAGNTFRVQPAISTDSLGSATRVVDFATPPFVSGPGQIVAGSTWNFQFWFRDLGGPGGTGFNLSNGLEVDYCP